MREIANYCLYHIPKGESGLNDVLMIFFGENKRIDKRELKDKLILMYSQNELVGYALLDFSLLVKIKIDGTIFLPNSALINIINNYLSSLKEDTVLLDKEESGFVVGEIIEKETFDKWFKYKVDIKSEIVIVESSFELMPHYQVCIAKVGTYLYPGGMIQSYQNKIGETCNGRICTYQDLQIQVSKMDEPLVMMEDELDIGVDFFMTEEKKHD